MLIFLDIVNKNIRFSRKYIDFILVYNLAKNSLHNQRKNGGLQDSISRILIGKHIKKKAGEELVLCDLGKFKGLYFKNVHTYSQKEFEEYIQNSL